jgi:fumigallin biosynthesis monooxygenase-like protein
MAIFPGRYVARMDGEFVVFIIGMRVNKPWRVRAWWPVFRAMPQMVEELEANPDSGFLGATRGFLTTGPTLVQYWRSFEHLERYARDPDAEHLPAWRRFNQRVRDSGDVGIWHETFRVRAGECEAIYGNMPRVGLAAVGEHLPIGSTAATAAGRIGARPDDRPPVPGY